MSPVALRTRILCGVELPDAPECRGCGFALTPCVTDDESVERAWACGTCRIEVVAVVVRASQARRRRRG